MKKTLSLIFALCLVLSMTVFMASAETATVATEAELTAALANGGDIQLTADITTTKAIVTSGVTATIDLNGKTLKIGAGDNKFNDASNLTIKNGTISIDGVVANGNAILCLDEYEETLVTTLTLENVDLVGEDYSSAYGIFYIGDSSVLNVNGGEWTLTNDLFSAGGVFKADDAKATLNITDTEMTLHNVRRVVTYATTVIDNSTITITGDPDGVDAEMEHGFNRSPLTIKNSTVTMTDLVGRGITAECGAVEITGSTVTMKNCTEATVDVRGGQTVTVASDSTLTMDVAPIITSGNIAGTVNVTYPVYLNETGYASLAEAIANIGSGDVVIELMEDATMNYNAREAYGTSETTSLTINGNGHTLTLNQKDSDWSSFGLANPDAVLVLNDMTIEKTGYGDTTGAWNTHAINITCTVEMNDVTINNSVSVKNGATLNNVTINEANGYYGLWIDGNGQTVTVNGGAINATKGGRGIKIADEYVGDAVAQVVLNVKGTKFTTAKKAAVLVSSTAGAKITAEDVDISEVAADPVNFVWVDEDWASYEVNVEVNGATKYLEGIVAKNGTSYYKTLDEAIAKAVDGDTVILTADVDYGTATLTINKAITLDLGGNTLTTNGTYGGLILKNNCTLKNGTLSHKGTVAAIKAWNVVAIEDLTIDVAFKAAGKVIGGIVIQEGSAVRIDTIKNVTIKGEGLTNGIQTYNCGNATENVIGSMENVTIDAQGTGMLISAPCGTATNCTVNGGVSGIEIWIKGTYSAKLDLVNCKVNGGTQAVYAHDEFNSNPDIENNGLLHLTTDYDTVFNEETNENVLTKIINRAKPENIIIEVYNRNTVTVEDSDKGTATVNRKSAVPGAIVTVTATPNPGYKVKTITVVAENGESVTVGGTSFKMPACNVTVTVTYEVDFSRPVWVTVKGTANAGETVTLSSNLGYGVQTVVADAKGNYSFSAVKFLTGGTYTFTVEHGETVETVVVTVTDVKDQLYASVTGSKADISIERDIKTWSKLLAIAD